MTSRKSSASGPAICRDQHSWDCDQPCTNTIGRPSPLAPLAHVQPEPAAAPHVVRRDRLVHLRAVDDHRALHLPTSFGAALLLLAATLRAGAGPGIGAITQSAGRRVAACT